MVVAEASSPPPLSSSSSYWGTVGAPPLSKSMITIPSVSEWEREGAFYKIRDAEACEGPMLAAVQHGTFIIESIMEIWI